MSDHNSAAIFSEIFTRLASDPTEQHITWARELWKITQKFDFAEYQMECDEALVKLGLARLEKGECLYGPSKKSKKSSR